MCKAADLTLSARYREVMAEETTHQGRCKGVTMAEVTRLARFRTPGLPSSAINKEMEPADTGVTAPSKRPAILPATTLPWPTTNQGFQEEAAANPRRRRLKPPSAKFGNWHRRTHPYLPAARRFRHPSNKRRRLRSGRRCRKADDPCHADPEATGRADHRRRTDQITVAGAGVRVQDEESSDSWCVLRLSTLAITAEANQRNPGPQQPAPVKPACDTAAEMAGVAQVEPVAHPTVSHPVSHC